MDAKKLIDWTKSIPGIIIGGALLISTLVGLANLFISNPRVSFIVSIVVILAGLLCMCLYFAFAKTPAKVHGGRSQWVPYLYEKYRPWAFMGIGLTIGIAVASIVIEPSRSFIVQTFTGIPTPAPTTQTSAATQSREDGTLRLESMPLVAFSYGGESDPAVGKGWSRLFIVYDKASTPGYRLDYTLPNDGYGYAGLAFKFSKSQNLSGYKFLEVALKFNDEQTRCELALKDISKKTNYVPVGIGVSLEKGATVTADEDRLIFRIPLDTGFKIAQEAVDEMGVLCDTDSSRGNHSFTVSEIKFIQP
jgi:hypothetical protein